MKYSFLISLLAHGLLWSILIKWTNLGWVAPLPISNWMIACWRKPLLSSPIQACIIKILWEGITNILNHSLVLQARNLWIWLKIAHTIRHTIRLPENINEDPKNLYRRSIKSIIRINNTKSSSGVSLPYLHLLLLLWKTLLSSRIVTLALITTST